MPEEYPLSTPTSDERTLGILSHILAIVPGIGIFGPLVIWLIKRDESQFVAQTAKESLNFQITLWIIAVILIITVIGLFLLWILGILNVILVIIATIKTSENKIYRYPFNFRLIK
jgi:uncharacterized Tic20 family protein